MDGSDGKALTAATGVLGIRIFKLESLVETDFGEIHFGAVEKQQALTIDDDLDALALENFIVFTQFVDEFDDIGQTRATGGFNTQSQADALTPVFEEMLHA